MERDTIGLPGNWFTNKITRYPGNTTPEYVIEENIITRMTEEEKLGVKTERGFYDYSEGSYAEILAKRDRQLIQSPQLAQQLMKDPLYTDKESEST